MAADPPIAAGYNKEIDISIIGVFRGGGNRG
jgi:hypothetical protein